MVVDPSGITYFYWSLVMMLAVLYNLLIIILRCMFDQPQKDYLTVCLVFDYICDVVYICDMFYSSRQGKRQK